MNPDRRYRIIEETMIENKHITVGSNSYKLTIIKRREVYTAYLSDLNSQFSTRRIFNKSELRPSVLEGWIEESDHMNNPETRFFESLKQWDGVVR